MQNQTEWKGERGEVNDIDLERKGKKETWKENTKDKKESIETKNI